MSRSAVRNALATQARFRREARSFVELVEFGVVGLVAGFQPLVNDHVARGAGADAAAGVVQAHVKSRGDVQDAAGQTVVAVGKFLRIHLDRFAFADKRHLEFFRRGRVFGLFDVRICCRPWISPS